MRNYLDIAAAYATESLTLIIGTGFSKWISDGKIPNWCELLVYCTDQINPELKEIFFKKQDDKYVEGEISLTVVAQMLEIEAVQQNKNLKHIICEQIRNLTVNSNINKENVDLFRSMFDKEIGLNIITTNYDTILSDYVFTKNAKIFTEGTSFSKISSGVNIFHIHGTIQNANSIVLTQSDYYSFQRKNNYFSRKLYTLLHENTTVLLGYSLNDEDIKFIINEANIQKHKSYQNGDIIYVVRRKIEDKLKEFYKYLYGIEVKSETDFEKYITNVTSQKKSAESLILNINEIEDHLKSDVAFDNDFIRWRDSFKQILNTCKLSGIDIYVNIKAYDKIVDVLKNKMDLCYEKDAWDQYVQLAEWIIEFLSLIEVEKLKTSEDIDKIIVFSLNTCSEKMHIGYSWGAYWYWKDNWKSMLPSNQQHVSDLIKHAHLENSERGIGNLCVL